MPNRSNPLLNSTDIPEFSVALDNSKATRKCFPATATASTTTSFKNGTPNPFGKASKKAKKAASTNGLKSFPDVFVQDSPQTKNLVRDC